jgi:hypothetical protein
MLPEAVLHQPMRSGICIAGRTIETVMHLVVFSKAKLKVCAFAAVFTLARVTPFAYVKWYPYVFSSCRLLVQYAPLA